MGTISIICGLIGAGKSTYAARHFENVTDLDMMPGWTKSDQIRKTMALYDSDKTVAHITCFPTIEEVVMIKNLPEQDIFYVWVDTPPGQCRKNILQRGRLSDVQNIQNVLRRNDYLYDKLISSKYPFRRVSIFEDTERW